MARVTSVALDDDVDERLRTYVYSRKMLEPSTSMASVINIALRQYLKMEDHGGK